jgi:hypothetical protein
MAIRSVHRIGDAATENSEKPSTFEKTQKKKSTACGGSRPEVGLRHTTRLQKTRTPEPSKTGSLGADTPKTDAIVPVVGVEDGPVGSADVEVIVEP